MASENPICQMFNIEHPILLAPMAGPGSAELAIGVAEGGGLASLPCAMLSIQAIRDNVGVIRQRTNQPFNLNFFCHKPPEPDAERDAGWRKQLGNYYDEFEINRDTEISAVARNPFNGETCGLVEELRPEVVSFHFGLPENTLLARVKATGAKIIASATTPAEARYLAKNGCDAIIAQGAEAGGHRGMFLSSDPATQMGTFSLVPQVVDAVDVPVIAAGGISDGRGVRAALALGASAVQVGTAYLFTPEANVPDLHRAALQSDRAEVTALTNVFSGRPARSITNRIMKEQGPISDKTPAFPGAGAALAPLKSAAEAKGSSDFSSLWAGQSARLAKVMDAKALTEMLASAID